MRDRSLDRLFDRFRRGGDVAALAKVFDRTAAEILRVAMSLVRNATEADDLLQETYLTAIERAPHYDSSGRLQAWLVGILVHHARELRRERARDVDLDPTRLKLRAPLGPHEALESLEISAELERALASLPLRDREVLDAHLRRGKGAAEIADETGRAPGTVRMQIHRGLDRLRKVLPAGLALGAAATVASGRGLAAVRAEVLRAGAASAASLAATSASAPAGAILLGGILVGKKVIVGVACAVLVGILVWLSLSPNHRAPERGAGGRETVAAVPTPIAPSAAAESRAPQSAVVASPKRPGESALYQRALCGICGRLLEHDGTPVPGVEIAFLQFRGADLLAPLAALFESESVRLDPIAATATTAADGRFEVRGAWARSFHALGIDLGGQRGALRLLEESLRAGEVTDLGDIRLAPTAALSGRVVDEGGKPVAHARVRVGELPASLCELGLTSLRANDALAIVAGNEKRVFELPPWLEAYERRLPIPTTTSDADGRFALDHVAAGRVTAVVDAPRFATLTLQATDLAMGDRRDLGDVPLTRGRTVRGRVVDASGGGATGAEILAGASAHAGFVVLHRAGMADAGGRFEVHGVGEGAVVVVAARATKGDPWVIVPSGDANRDVLVELSPRATITVDVSDDRGSPLTDAEFALVPGAGQRESQVLTFFPFGKIKAVADERVPGRHRLANVGCGRYMLVVRAKGHGIATAEVDASGDGAPLSVVLPRGRGVDVIVRDARTEAPIDAAEVAVLDDRGVTHAFARTNADGAAGLGDVSSSESARLHVRVDHPAYASSTAPVTANENRIGVDLGVGGSLVAQLRSPPPLTTAYALTLVRRDAAAFPDSEIVLTATFDAGGIAQVTHLSPGKWSWSLHPAFGGTDPFSLLSTEFRRDTQRSGDVEIRSDETAQIEIVLPESAQLAADDPVSSSFKGSIRVDGAPVRDVQLSLNRHSKSEPAALRATSDAKGAFDFGLVPPGRYTFAARSWDRPTGGPVGVIEYHSERIELSPGEVRDVAYEWTTIAAGVRVVSAADGSPVADASVVLYPMDVEAGGLPISAVTNAEGRAVLTIVRAGDYSVRVIHVQRGSGKGSVHVTADGFVEPLTVVLSEGVACSGQVVVDESLDVGPGAFLILYKVEDPSARNQCALSWDGRRSAFRIVGLDAGGYVATAFTGKAWTGAAPVELPPGGSTAFDLVLPLPPNAAESGR